MSQAFAWDGVGHEQVNDLAWQLLRPETKVKIAKALLLGDSKYRPQRPTGEMKPAYLESAVRPMFRKAGLWPDDIKGGPSESFEEWVNRYNANSPGVRPPADVFARGTEETRMKTWHYVDFPVFYAGTGEPTQPRPSNALYGLKIIQTRLQSTKSDSAMNERERAFWIYWATHIIADIHQPLHCTEHFGAEFLPGGDDGGNQFLYRLPGQTREFRLHGWWDDGIEKAIQLDGLTSVASVTNAWLSRSDLKPSASEIANLNWESIAKAHAQLSVKYVYAGLTHKGELPADYNRRTADLCRRQAVLGAHRMAKFLNDVLSN
jgi:hypothetical protein